MLLAVTFAIYAVSILLRLHSDIPAVGTALPNRTTEQRLARNLRIVQVRAQMVTAILSELTQRCNVGLCKMPKPRLRPTPGTGSRYTLASASSS